MKKDCKQHVQESTEQLKKNGLKITTARLGLLDILKHAKKPLSIKEITQQLDDESVDPVTLYRNVESLEKLGLLKKIRLNDRQAYYELTAIKHHHHLICKQCGKIADITDCKVTIANKDLLKKTKFTKITDHSLEFFGICKNCSK
jgi:Fe2+ or Zn2+ uptake regulation protein